MGSLRTTIAAVGMLAMGAGLCCCLSAGPEGGNATTGSFRSQTSGGDSTSGAPQGTSGASNGTTGGSTVSSGTGRSSSVTSSSGGASGQTLGSTSNGPSGAVTSGSTTGGGNSSGGNTTGGGLTSGGSGASGCTSGAACSAGSYCDISSHCAPQQADGTGCSENSQCWSGFCVGLFCCNTACGPCGNCSNGTDTGTCEVSPAGTPKDKTCAPYLCDGIHTACPTSCDGGNGCVTGWECSSGICIPAI